MKKGKSFKQIFKEFVNGKKIRRSTWSKRSYWMLKDGVIINNKGRVLNDWEVVDNNNEGMKI